jgi:hypothetical protein
MRRLLYSIVLITLYKSESARLSTFATISIVAFGSHIYLLPFASPIDNNIEGFSLLIIGVLSSVSNVPSAIKSILLLLPIGVCLSVLGYTVAREFINYRKHFSRSNLGLISFSRQFFQDYANRAYHDTNGLVVEEFAEKDAVLMK